MQNKPFDPATANLEKGYNPSMDHLVGTEAASEEEEQVLAQAMAGIMDYLYSDEGLPAVVNKLKQDPRELFEKIPDLVVPLLMRARTDNEEADAATFFGEGALIQNVVQLLWEIAEQEEVPGVDDEEQLEAAIINTYRKVGEFVHEEGDPNSVDQAQNLAIDMVLTNEDGTKQTPEQYKDTSDPLAEGVRQGLLS